MQKKKQTAVVKYSNNLNEASFASLSTIEIKLFMTIISRVDEQNSNVVEIPFSEFRKLIGTRKHLSNTELADAITSLYRKLLDVFNNISSRYCDGKKTVNERMVRFIKYRVDSDAQLATISVNEEFIPWFNDLNKNFTYYGLGEYVSLKNKYALNLYPRIMQFGSTGHYTEDIDPLCYKLGITDSLQSHLDTKVLIPACEDINSVVPNLDLQYEKNRGHKNKIESVTFVFNKRTKNKRLSAVCKDADPASDADNLSAEQETAKRAAADERTAFVCELLNLNADGLNDHEKRLINAWYTSYDFDKAHIKCLIATAKNIADSGDLSGRKNTANIAYIGGILQSWNGRRVKKVSDLTESESRKIDYKYYPDDEDDIMLRDGFGNFLDDHFGGL